MHADQGEGSIADRKELQPGIPGEMRGDGDQPAADDDEDALPHQRQLARDPQPGADQRGVGGVAEEEPDHLPEVPLDPGHVGPKALAGEDRVHVRHVEDRLHEVEAEPHAGAVHDAVDHVVKLVPHHQVEEEHRQTLRQLLEEAGAVGGEGVHPGPRHQRAGGDLAQ